MLESITGATAMYVAIIYGRPAVVRVLSEAGVPITNVMLDMAIIRGELAVVEQLCTLPGVISDIVPAAEYTSVRIAMMLDHPTIGVFMLGQALAHTTEIMTNPHRVDIAYIRYVANISNIAGNLVHSIGARVKGPMPYEVSALR
jgi:hypothetical protein